MSRQCGSCTFCCTNMGVRELDKPIYTPCVHECKGCAIYPTRPQSCADFQCLWLQGGLPHDMRPDKVGMMATPNVDGGDIVVFVFAPTDMGGWHRPRIRKLLGEWMVKGIKVILKCGDRLIPHGALKGRTDIHIKEYGIK